MKKVAYLLAALSIVSCHPGVDPTSSAEKAAPTTLEGAVALSVNNSSSRDSFVVQEITNWNAFITDPAVRTDKFTQMKADAFSFYRGTAHLYYKDLDNGTIAVPSAWPGTANIRTWLQGDLHPQNLGFFDNKNGNVVFDVNDFDESFVAPFYWDLVRFSAGIYLLQGLVDFNLSSSEADDVVWTFLTNYQDVLTLNQSKNLTSGNTSGFVKNRIDDLTASQSNATLLSTWTKVVSGNRVFDFSNPKIIVPSGSQASEITTGWSSYTSSLGSVYTSRGASYYTVKDKAVRILSGLGSLGVLKFYVLIQGPSSSNSDDLILEVKEQRVGSMFQSTQVSLTQCNSWFSSQGWRVFTANKALLKDAEDNSGVLIASKSYAVKKLSPWKDSFDPSDFNSQTDLDNFAKWAGTAIAQGHNRSDNDYSSTYVPYSANTGILNAIAAWPNAKTTIRQLGKDYAAQVNADWGFFKAAF